MQLFDITNYLKLKKPHRLLLLWLLSNNASSSRNTGGIVTKDRSNKRQKISIMNRLTNSALNIRFFKNKKKSEAKENFIDKFDIISVHMSNNDQVRLKKPLLSLNEENSSNIEFCPASRSGHRIFATEDYIYLIGGYNPNVFFDQIFTDIWRFNLATERWQEGSMRNGVMPTCLASFSLSQTTLNNEAFIFGGTGIPFGVKASNELYRVCVETSGSVSLERQIIEADEGNIPPKMYGHAMSYVTEYDSETKSFIEIIYLVGGTTGHIYNMDVWKLQTKKSKKNVWSCTLLTHRDAESGRYRLEIVKNKHHLITFGGGDLIFCADFDKLLSFNINEEKYENLLTVPDEKYGYPNSRKCHAIVHFEDCVYIIGGCRDIPIDVNFPDTSRLIMDDVWRIDLNTNIWKKMETKLPVAVFFHSAAVTKEGCVYVFGGCTDIGSKCRTNFMQKMWLKPPPLRFFATHAVLNAAPQLRNADAVEAISRVRNIILSEPNNVILSLIANPCSLN